MRDGRLGRLWVRLAFAALAGLSLLFVAEQSLRTDFSELEIVAGRITAGQSFDSIRLARLAPRLLARVPGQCGTSARSAAIIWMRLAQDAKSSRDADAERLRHEKAVAELEGYLSCSPADSYAWLLLFHLKQSEDTGAQNVALLELSYRLAPLEGWLMPVRSGVALPLLQQLSPDVQALALRDIKIMARERPDAAVAVFSNLQPAEQRIVLPVFRDLSEAERKELARRLDDLEIDADLNLGTSAPRGTLD